MSNAKYIKGVKLEREIVNLAKEHGCASWRSAGSHGVYDVQVIGSFDAARRFFTGLLKKGFFHLGQGDYVMERAGKKYKDTLFYDWYLNSNGYAYFFQMKRKEIKGGKNK